MSLQILPETTMPNGGKKDFKLTGQHVLAMMLGFFGLIIAVNALFIFLALETWTGLVSDKAYVEGLSYNEKIAEGRRQAALGWTVDLGLVTLGQGGEAGRDVMVRVDVSEEAGPVPVDRVEVLFRHVIFESRDVAIEPLKTGPGRFEGRVSLPEAGQWDVRIVVEDADGQLFRRDSRVEID